MKRRKKPEPLASALLLQKHAARLGFDWDKTGDLWKKLAEEIDELKAVARQPRQAEDELGDLLFMAVNLARHLDVNAERALRGANRKFSRRFAYILEHGASLPPVGSNQRLDAMEKLWQQAKRKGL